MWGVCFGVVLTEGGGDEQAVTTEELVVKCAVLVLSLLVVITHVWRGAGANVGISVHEGNYRVAKGGMRVDLALNCVPPVGGLGVAMPQVVWRVC